MHQLKLNNSNKKLSAHFQQINSKIARILYHVKIKMTQLYPHQISQNQIENPKKQMSLD